MATFQFVIYCSSKKEEDMKIFNHLTELSEKSNISRSELTKRYLRIGIDASQNGSVLIQSNWDKIVYKKMELKCL